MLKSGITSEVCCRCSLTTANGCFHLYSYFSKTELQTQECLKVKCTDFIAKDQTHQTSTHSTTMCECDAWSISHTSAKAKPKTITELESTLQQIWDDLPHTTINKAINDFRKTSERVHFGRWWTFWALLCELFALNMAQLRQSWR